MIRFIFTVTSHKFASAIQKALSNTLNSSLLRRESSVFIRFAFFVFETRFDEVTEQIQELNFFIRSNKINEWEIWCRKYHKAENRYLAHWIIDCIAIILYKYIWNVYYKLKDFIQCFILFLRCHCFRIQPNFLSPSAHFASKSFCFELFIFFSLYHIHACKFSRRQKSFE